MQKGLVHIYTGDGKGKTSAALGLCFRALGYQKRIHFIQFLKASDTGEVLASARFEGLITFHRPCTLQKFYFSMDEQEKLQTENQVQQCLKLAESFLLESDILVLDEIFGAVSLGLISEAWLTDFIEKKPIGTELVLTGRDAPETVVALADYVSNLQCIKHPYDKNQCARKGIEY